MCPSLLHMELVGYDFLAIFNLFRKEDSHSAWASPTCHGKCRRRTGTFHNLTLIKDELKIFEVNFCFKDELGICYDFTSDESVFLLEHGLYGFCTLIVVEPLPFHQVLKKVMFT